jgi:acyl-CoA synthetase (AMP-forming)/AMP-acid ligase II
VQRLPDIPFPPTLPSLLNQAVERFGDDDYVVMPDRRVSFAEAQTASRKLAKRMLEAGVGKGTRVAIILPTGIDWVIAWLAAGSVGAFPMLFPATYRPAELRRALRISDTTVLFAAPTLLGKDYEAFLEEAVPALTDHDASQGPLHDPRVPFLRSVWIVGDSDRAWATTVDAGPDADEPAISDELLDAVESEVSPADPLLVIYTSGSSADPKAIIHTHGATIRKVQAELGMCLPGSFPGRTFCAMPFFWVGGPQDLLGALHSGAAVISQERFDVSEALELLERERCTSILGWATVLEQLQADPDWERRDLSALQLPQGGSGAALTSSRGDPRNVGMTETFGPHANPEWFDYKIIDHDTGEELPEGEEGEFCVRGFGLMAGMYKKEREEVFDADGFYHTGDRGYVENGHIWFKGRYTEMVKAGGANVAPLEVEQVLLSAPGVRMAFVMGVPDAERGEVVAAVVVPGAGASLDPDELAQHVNTQLSHYKVPTRWAVNDESEIPFLASGKPDKRTMKTWFEEPG